MKNRYLSLTGRVLFGLLVGLALLATVLPFLPFKVWYVRIFDYPRLQAFFISLIAFAWYVVFYFRKNPRSFVYTAGLLTVMAIQAYKSYPYTPLGEKQVLWSERDPSDTTAVSLLICNVLQKNTAYDQVIARVGDYQPDLVITTETDSVWQAALSVIEPTYPHRVAVPLSNTYGLHLYSRLPLDETEVRFLVEPDIPSIRTRVRLRSGEWVHLFVVHPRPPVPGEETDSRERDAEIVMVGREAELVSGGAIVAGDFNDVAWSKTTELFQRVSGFLDPRRGRGFYNTFHAKYPLIRWPLDHLFHSSHFKLLRIECLEDVGSDHFPVYLKLSYEPEEAPEQPEVPKKPDTDRKATETILKGKIDAAKELQEK